MIESTESKPPKQVKSEQDTRSKAISGSEKSQAKARSTTKSSTHRRPRSKNRHAADGTTIMLAPTSRTPNDAVQPLIDQPPMRESAHGIEALSPAQLTELAKQMERTGLYDEALKYYRQAADAGHGPASLRLAELYITGANGVDRDYAESIRWYQRAREQGMPVPALEKR